MATRVAAAIPNSARTRIIGIDPGSRFTGIGIIDADAHGKLVHVFHTALTVGKEASFPLRLKRIFEEVCAIIGTHEPDECGIERVFMARNADSALKLGQARGAAICAVVSRGVEVHEYSATQVKQSAVGSGRADKTQVQHMVGVLLGVKTPLQADAADALAIAITHAHMRDGVARLGLQLSRPYRRRR